MSTLISYAFIICHSPQKSSVAQKVYKRTSGPDNDHEAVFPALDGLMADADTQLGIDRGRHIFIVYPDHRRTAGEPLYLPVESKATKLTKLLCS